MAYVYMYVYIYILYIIYNNIYIIQIYIIQILYIIIIYIIYIHAYTCMRVCVSLITNCHLAWGTSSHARALKQIGSVSGQHIWPGGEWPAPLRSHQTMGNPHQQRWEIHGNPRTILGSMRELMFCELSGWAIPKCSFCCQLRDSKDPRHQLFPCIF